MDIHLPQLLTLVISIPGNDKVSSKVAQMCLVAGTTSAHILRADACFVNLWTPG
jgi:hypothetical protein